VNRVAADRAVAALGLWSLEFDLWPGLGFERLRADPFERTFAIGSAGVSAATSECWAVPRPRHSSTQCVLS
jgi:hypothetical protein